MADGDSFVIYLGSPRETSSVAEEHSPSNDAVLNDDHDYDDSSTGPRAPQAEDMDHESITGSATGSDGRRPARSRSRGSQQQSDHMQTVKLYCLHRPTVQGRVRWGQFDNLMVDVARLLTVPVARISALHYMRAQPVGDADQIEPIIVQLLHDIPDGSTDKLLLLDVETHQTSHIAQLPVTPLVTRQVYRVVTHMARTHVLLTGGVAHLCGLYHDRCLVHMDHTLWSMQDIGVRTLHHGHYIRIVVPESNEENGIADRPLTVNRGQSEATLAGDGLQETSGPVSSDQSVPTNQLRPTDQQDHQDVPIILEPGEPLVNMMPKHDGNVQWYTDLHVLFGPNSNANRYDEGSYIHVMTWYIHHENRRECERPRPVRLSNQVITWLDDLRRAWMDHMDPVTVLAVHIVRPTPARDRRNQHACHILLEQAHHPAVSAGIATGLIEGEHTDWIIQKALSVGSPIHFQEVKARLRLDLDLDLLLLFGLLPHISSWGTFSKTLRLEPQSCDSFKTARPSNSTHPPWFL